MSIDFKLTARVNDYISGSGWEDVIISKKEHHLKNKKRKNRREREYERKSLKRPNYREDYNPTQTSIIMLQSKQWCKN